MSEFYFLNESSLAPSCGQKSPIRPKRRNDVMTSPTRSQVKPETCFGKTATPSLASLAESSLPTVIKVCPDGFQIVEIAHKRIACTLSCTRTRDAIYFIFTFFIFWQRLKMIWGVPWCELRWTLGWNQQASRWVMLREDTPGTKAFVARGNSRDQWVKRTRDWCIKMIILLHIGQNTSNLMLGMLI